MSRSCRSGALSKASTSASACGSTRRPLGPCRLRCLLAPAGAMGTTGLFDIGTPINGFPSMVPCSYICPIDCKKSMNFRGLSLDTCGLWEIGEATPAEAAAMRYAPHPEIRHLSIDIMSRHRLGHAHRL